MVCISDRTVTAVVIASVMAVVVAAAASIKVYYGKKNQPIRRHSILPLDSGTKCKFMGPAQRFCINEFIYRIL